MSNEDFVMVESLKTPFADGDGLHDVGAFFRDCQSAPLSLQSFRAIPADIGTQLEQFEKDLQGYDDLVKALCHHPDDNSKWRIEMICIKCILSRHSKYNKKLNPPWNHCSTLYILLNTFE